MRPLAVDLCAGAGGITAGMLAAGFEVLGIDVVWRRDYPAPLLVQDVRQVDSARLGRPAWVHASPPCQRFSQMRMSRTTDPPSEADLDVLKACLRIIQDLQPRFWSVENVRGAVPWFEPLLGPPRLQHGPFFFWGNFPPFLVDRAGLDRHRSPWLRAKVPLELSSPLARACADALTAPRPSGKEGKA